MSMLNTICIQILTKLSFIDLEKINKAAYQPLVEGPTFSTHVLAHFAYHKIPQTGWHINSRNIFQMVLEAGNLKLSCQHDQVRTLFLKKETFLISLHMAEETRKLCGIFYESTDFILKGFMLMR